MINLAVLAVYLLGYVLSVRPALRRRMLRKCCEMCRRNIYHTTCKGKPRAVRGAISDRNGVDAFVAILEASWWPVRLLALWLAFLLGITGRGIGAVVLSGKLTMPEMERHERERTDELQRFAQEHSTDVVVLAKPTFAEAYYDPAIVDDLTPEAGAIRRRYLEQHRSGDEYLRYRNH